jgi:soluble lytic murein transglycosylase-like protein
LGIRIFHHIGPLVAALALAAPAHAAEYAVLANGFRIHADRHEVEGGRVRLFINGGVTEFATGEIASFEQEEAVAVPVIAAPPQVVLIPQVVNKDMFTAAAEKHGLPVALVRSVVRAESNFQPNALSPKGAIGLMQLMPETARELGVDPHVPEQNLEAGTRYLRDLLIKYEGNENQVALAIAAYNAGPAAVDKYKGVPPYLETQSYVRRVLQDYVTTTAKP